MEATHYKYYLPNDRGTDDYEEYKRALDEYDKEYHKREEERQKERVKLDRCNVCREIRKERFHKVGQPINAPLKAYKVICYRDEFGNIVKEEPFDQTKYEYEVERHNSFIVRLRCEIEKLSKSLKQ